MCIRDRGRVVSVGMLALIDIVFRGRIVESMSAVGLTGLLRINSLYFYSPSLSIAEPSHTKSSPLFPAQPPRPQRQRLQLHRRRPDKRPERHGADDDAQHVRDVVTVDGNITGPASVDAAVFFGLGDAGKGRCDGVGCFERGGGRGRAGGDGEGVDEFEDEEAGKGAAEVGNAVCSGAEGLVS